MACLGDDLGTQTGSLLGPRIVREFLVPEYRRLFRLYREHGVMIGFHSCGNVDAVLETFMELGVDVLNPVQATRQRPGAGPRAHAGAAWRCRAGSARR